MKTKLKSQELTATWLGSVKSATIALLVMLFSTTAAWALTPNEGDIWDATTKTLTINNSVGAGNGSYNYRTEIEHLVINPGVEFLDANSFLGCSNLQDVTYADGAIIAIINYRAFEGCTSLTTITIPASIKTLMASAFWGCTSLQSINVDENNEKFASEDGVLFDKAKTTLMLYPIAKSGQSYTVPSSVTSINEKAFYGCANLTAITIPASVTQIGKQAFDYTGWYNSHADGPLYLGDWLLAYKGSEPAAPYALEVADGTKRIAEFAFKKLENLITLTIPASVTTIGKYAFDDCEALESVTFATDSKLEVIDEWAFHKCFALKSITIPASVTTIGGCAFNNCVALTGITIPAGITTIGESTFENCKALESVTFETGSKLENIGISSFKGCVALTGITIPASVTTIGETAFEGCSNLATVIVADGSVLTTISQDAFKETAWLNQSGLQYLGNIAYRYSGEATDVTINDGTVMIYEKCFKANKTLQSVSIPASVTTIGKSAFEYCSNLSTVIVADGSVLTTISEYAFNKTAWLNQSGLQYLGNIAYRYSGEATDVTINDGTVMIYEKCFYENETLQSVTIPASVTTIGKYAFDDCEALESVTFATGSKLEVIDEWAFCNCIALKSITIPASVTTLNEGAIGDCENLESVTFEPGSKLEFIGDYAFEFIHAMTGITIPASVKSIGYQAFWECSALTDITIPASVTSIGEEAFGDCTSMTDMYCYANPAVLEWNDVDTYSINSNGKTKIHVLADKLSAFQSKWSSDTYIEFVGDQLKASNIDGNCWTTFYCGDNGFKIDDTENACAYTATVGTNEIVLHKLGKVIPEGTAVIIVGEDDIISMTIDNESYAENKVDNDLLGVDAATPLNTLIDGSEELYVLSNKNNNFGFHYFTATNVPAHKAYLVLPPSAGARSFSMVFEDEATAIRELRVSDSELPVYDLNGRVVNGNSLKSGIYIKNGKKVVIK